MIWKNFFRELYSITSRLTSVIIITIVAVMVFVGLNGIDYNGNKIVKNYLEEQNAADYWITGIKFNEDDYNEVKKIEGISEIDKRIALEGNEVDNKEIKLAVYGLSNEYTMNKPYIVQGTLPKNKTEAMISSEFAKEQGLSVGDEYSINIPGYPKELTFEISALIKNSERMYNISKAIPSPDYSKYGFIYVNEETINNILGENIYNQLCIKLDDNADVEYIENEIIEKLNSKIINITEIKDNVNTYNLLDFINGIEPIIKGLPLIFFVIAALLMVSTMSRLIENSRLAIGTLKALGYTDFIIMLYYLLYSVIVVVMGFAIGGFLSINIITKPISDILFKLNDLPPYFIEYDKNALLQAFILTVITTVGTSIIITRNALREKPAQCMRPKAPKKERRLLIERITPIWSKMSFSKKYIIKNTFRNRSRVLTCIIGISACMALILTCFSLKDSINNFTDKIVN
ncbi:MAG: ABC transporter permease, partial [Clostridium sp.]